MNTQKSRSYPRKFAGARRQFPAAPRQPVPAAAPTKPVTEVTGDAGLWVTLQRVYDPATGWVKTTRAAQTPAGVLINTCSRRRGATSASEALALLPGCRLSTEGKILPA